MSGQILRILSRASCPSFGNKHTAGTNETVAYDKGEEMKGDWEIEREQQVKAS